jgi:hypothetical protein
MGKAIPVTGLRKFEVPTFCRKSGHTWLRNPRNGVHGRNFLTLV